MQVCVTGADGFIGSHLVERLLADGHDVRALAQYNSFGDIGWLARVSSSNSLEIIHGDVRDSKMMRNFVSDCEAVLHLASLIAIPYSYVAPQSYVETNVIGTLNVLEASRDQGVSKFIQTSTSEVYGTAKKVPINEGHPLQPQSPYSASKIAADALAQSFWHSFSLPVTTVRPFNTFGPRQSTRAVIATLFSQAIRGGGKIKLGSLAPTRDFTYVDDTVSGFIAALNTNGIEGSVINLGTGHEISIRELIALVSEISGQDFEVETDPKRLRPETSEVERLVSDNSLAASSLGWQPKFSGIDGLKRGLQITYEWFLSESKTNPEMKSDFVL